MRASRASESSISARRPVVFGCKGFSTEADEEESVRPEGGVDGVVNCE